MLLNVLARGTGAAEGRMVLRAAPLVTPVLVTEVRGIDAQAPALVHVHEAAHGGMEALGVPVGRETHRLPFVVVGLEAAELRRRLVERAERVGEVRLTEGR